MEHIPVRQIPHAKKEPGLSGSFSIRDIDVLLNGDRMVEDLHRHDFFYILALNQGSGSHEIDFVSYAVSDHSIFLMRPGQVHKLTLNAGSKGYLLQFKDDFFTSQNVSAKELLRKVSHKKLCTLQREHFEKLRTILDNILTEFSEKQKGFEDVIISNLNIFFIEMVRHRLHSESTPAERNTYSHEKLEQFIDLVESDLIETKQVSEYANKLNISTYQLGTITKTLLNKTPSEVINQYVVLEAKRQLLATTNQVNQVAYHLGYEDVSYFIRFFKKHTGHSPESFRNISR